MNKLTKTIGIGSLALVLNYCSAKHTEYLGQKEYANTYEFSTMGEIAKLVSSHYKSSQIAIGDMDGDGDLDIVVLDSSSDDFNKLSILENKIEQKSK